MILFLYFLCAGLLTYAAVPLVLSGAKTMHERNTKDLVLKTETQLQDIDIQKAYRMQLIGPIVLGILGFMFAPTHMQGWGIFIGLALGFVFPRIYIQQKIQSRKKKFNDQLMDSLMIMSSSFRGGLSLIQAVEAVVEEMPDPIRHEFGIVLGENKMGVALEESLNRLYQRMPSPGLQQMITAILLARETGGNLPLIFSRIITSMRERKKIEQNLQTLTIQGRIQAAVMTGLPVFFVFGVSASNPHFFDSMLNTPDGQRLMVICLVLWVLGALSIMKISKFKDA